MIPCAARVSLRCRAARRRAFTLVELLLVVAIVAVLAGLLFPLGAYAVAAARGMHCQNNLRELARCFKLYMQDNGNVFPPMRATGGNESLLREMADEEQLTLSGTRNAGGYHWSLLLWPYHRNVDIYTCPADPNVGRRGDVSDDGLPSGSPFLDAPPESYGLNTLLFRSMPLLRQKAGASWGLNAGTYQSELTFTTRTDQKAMIPHLDRRVLLCCGASGYTVGHPSNIVWRDCGLSARTRRSEWHPWPGPDAFTDARGHGSYYLFFSGAAEYREEFPSRFEWALDLK